MTQEYITITKRREYMKFFNRKGEQQQHNHREIEEGKRERGFSKRERER
jgi:hypothetical protein